MVHWMLDFKQKIMSLALKLTRSIYSTSNSTQKNVLFSPVNVYTALGLCHLGASCTTRNEISQIMELANDENVLSSIHKSLSNILKSVQKTKESNVSLASGMFVQKLSPLKVSFLQFTKKYYDSEIANVDFQNGGNVATNYINKWISEKTRGRIPQLYTEQLSSNTKVLIASSLYFSAKWAHPFIHYGTELAKFNTGISEIDVDMMHSQKQMSYINNENASFEAVTLPYEGDEFMMQIFLPYANQTIKNLIDYLTVDELVTVSDQMQKSTEYVDYKMPRMKFKWSESITDQLQALGIKKLFEQNADLSNMVSSTDLRVTDITHAAEIECDEKGTVASAATTLEYEPYSGVISSSEPIKFHVNRPFVFFINHRETSTLLFAGVVHEPVGFN